MVHIKNASMKNILLLLILFSIPSISSAQEDENRGTIKVEKKGQLAKIVYDNVNYRLVGIDQYGNPKDSAVIEFEMKVTIKGIFYSEKATGPVLSYKMQQLLSKCDRTSILFFEKIKAKDNYGNILNMPNFKYAIAYRNESEE